MKILFYSSYFYPYLSGLTAYPLRLLEQLGQKHKITVLTFPHVKGLKKEEKIKGLKIKRLGYLFRISKGFISPQSWGAFFKEVQKNDAIILNLPNFEALPLALIAKLFKKKSVSIFVCEVFLGKDFLSRLIVWFLNISVFVQLLLSDKIIAIPDYIEQASVYSLFQKKIIKALPIIETKKVNIKTLNKFKQEKKENIWIGFVGRIAREKGVEYLLQAVDSIKEKKKIKLLFVGPGKEETVGENSYFNHIEKELRRKKIPYEILGRLTDEDLGAFYKAIDMLVLPSINRTEAFGMVQAEAMLLGTPVISIDIPGVRLPIKLTGMGVLVKPKSSKAISRGILEIIKNKSLYTNKSMIKKSERIFLSRETFNVYEKLLSNPS